MKCLTTLGAVLAFVSVCHTTPQIRSTVIGGDRSVAIGHINGGTYGPGSFSTGPQVKGHPGQTQVYVNEDSGGEHIFTQTTNHKGQQDNIRRLQHDNANRFNSGGTKTQVHPARPQTTFVNTEQRGRPGQRGSGGSAIVIGTVVLPDHNKNNRNNVNKRPDAGVSAINDILASNNENYGISSTGVSIASGGGIAIGAITGGQFGEGSFSTNNQRPGANVPLFSTGHNVNNPGNAGVSYTHDLNTGIQQSVASTIQAALGSNSRDYAVSSVGNGFSTDGQGSVAIGAINGGYYEEGSFDPSNRRPGVAVAQQQNIEYHNPGNVATRAIGRGTNGFGNSYNYGQSSRGYNAFNNENPWI